SIANGVEGDCKVSLSWFLGCELSLDSSKGGEDNEQPNGEALRKCILSGPYKPTTVLVQAVEATDDSLIILEHTTVETPMNMSPENKAHFLAEKEAIHLILTGIGDQIYSTMDACQIAQEMWEAIERYKGKEIAKPITPPSEKTSKEDSNPEQAQRDKDTDEEFDEQEMEAHYSYMAKIQEVPTADTGTDSEPVEQVQNNAGYNVFANDLQQSEQSKSVSNTCLVEANDSNVIPDSPDMCEDAIQNDQNDVESDDKRVALANLITNLKLDVDENKKIQNVRDSCLVTLQTKKTEFEKYKAFNDRTIDHDKLERKLNETIGELDQKDTEIKEGLKTKTYELSVVKEKHDELVKQSLLTKSHYEGLVKQKTKVITDLKHREEHDIDKMLSIEKQLKFLNEIVYKRSQSIQTIYMMAPKVPTYNGRPTFANPRYLKQAQSEIPCLYAFPYDQSTHENRLISDGEEILALEREKIVDNAWIKHLKDQFHTPTAQDIEILIQTCLMPVATKTQNDSFRFVHELKQEMHADLKYVESLKKEIDELKSDKAEFLNMYDVILQECVSNDGKCSYLQSLSDLDVLAKLQCLFLHKVKECDCLAQKLSNQTESVSKGVYNELLKCFAKVEKTFNFS
nr:hypothetical protein [Tanacetum cinerariifolium]